MSDHGFYTIFGFTRETESKLINKFADRLGIAPNIIGFGDFGRLFYHTTYGDVAESETSVVIKLGLARNGSYSNLSAKQILQNKAATPNEISNELISGSYLIIALSKRDAKFIVFKNLLSCTQLYYFESNGNIFACDNLKYLLKIIDIIQLNEKNIPFHFLFRHMPGSETYFKDIFSLMPGKLMKWNNGKLFIKLQQDLKFSENKKKINRIDDKSVASFTKEFNRVVISHLNRIESTSYNFANLLSGGIDSSLLQIFINHNLKNIEPNSFSYAPINAPSFSFEIDYAKEASTIFNTKHSLVDVSSDDYAAFLLKTIDTLAQPFGYTFLPFFTAMADCLKKHFQDIRFLFHAQLADTLFGLSSSPKLRVLAAIQKLQKLTGDRRPFKSTLKRLDNYGLVNSIFKNKIKILSDTLENDLSSVYAPINNVGIYTDFDIVRNSFGDKMICDAFEYRRELQIEYLNSNYYPEVVHLTNLLTNAYELETLLFLDFNIELLCPFLDYNIVRMSFEFDPKVRYANRFQAKEILKRILIKNGYKKIAVQRKGRQKVDELTNWLKSGALGELVQDINLPGFISKQDFSKILNNSDFSSTSFLYYLLVLDLFKKRILKTKHK